MRERTKAGRRNALVRPALAACALALAGAGACSGGDDPEPTSTTTSSTTTTAVSTTTTTTTTTTMDPVDAAAVDSPTSTEPPQAVPAARDLGALVDEYNRLDQECRGQSGDRPETWLACDLREAFAIDLESSGQCLGDQDWSECGSSAGQEWITHICDVVDVAYDIVTSRVDCGEAETLIRQVSATTFAVGAPATVDRFTCMSGDDPRGTIVRCGDYGTSLEPVDTAYGAVIWRTR